MEVLFFITGVILLAIGISDLLWTSLWLEGSAGPVSRYLSAWCWSFSKKTCGRRPLLLSLAGPVILLLTVFVWILFVWAGWTFIFLGSEDSLTTSAERQPITWLDKVYFVGYTIFTLGNGEFKPNGGFWQIATVLANAFGMLFFTMSITYVISIVNAVSLKRSFAESVTGLGKNGNAIVKQSWNGRDFSNIDSLLQTYALQLGALTEQHRAYPILHFYHSETDQKALAVAVADLDEALTVFRYGVAEQYQPNRMLLNSARATVDNYLETLVSVFIKPADKTPPATKLDRLRSSGLPLVPDSTYLEAVANLETRRKKLLGMTQSDMRNWPFRNEG